MFKIPCIDCSKPAVWFYPSSEDYNFVYCDEHVSRVECSCLYNKETNSYEKDDQGRLLPCADYMYWEDGVNMILFWKPTPVDEIGPNCLCQWYPSHFEIDGIDYDCAEQYMMAEKAKLFNDEETRQKILKVKNDPHKCKHLGRQVKNFEQNTWHYVAKDIVYQGNYAKFSQNPLLKEYLLSTGSDLLVEASPYDKIWGIGLNEEDAKKTPPLNWPGTNWLGEVLMKVRNDLDNAFDI